jgi:predicted phage tail protein
MIRDIFVHGTAGRRFGRHFRLDVSSPGEAVRALCTLRPGLRATLREGLWRVIVGPPHLANAIEVKQLGMTMGRQPLHLVPATSPRGGGVDVGKVIVGTVLVGAAIFLTGGIGAAFATPLIASAGITYGAVVTLGVSMVLAGVSGLLSQAVGTGNAASRTSPLDAPSFLFNGVTNNTQPGSPVPLVYGTFLTGSVLVGAGLQMTDIPQWFT